MASLKNFIDPNLTLFSITQKYFNLKINKYLYTFNKMHYIKIQQDNILKFIFVTYKIKGTKMYINLKIRHVDSQLDYKNDITLIYPGIYLCFDNNYKYPVFYDTINNRYFSYNAYENITDFIFVYEGTEYKNISLETMTKDIIYHLLTDDTNNECDIDF